MTATGVDDGRLPWEDDEEGDRLVADITHAQAHLEALQQQEQIAETHLPRVL
eukprot:CAMPEP_0177534094 /NCGR_PEP_ID=MMETSP0369-20130122/55722_1 /TAXON_ID=447022 ORGANISM="Scrippsiella hangoei-like, Strain SHHI-4" /NCGR_SAMPLE_ID=MMETSP0369 /ASSEMBLY_ACC=CAM_ASM_000364 /LENGTH=51 /DNA_ID=CAMNT_0019015939 /DNA_START=11 /DNA_END=164 /DNA_ORIENTATION=+